MTELFRIWNRYKRPLLLAGIALMLVAGAARWPYELNRALVWVDHPSHDLRLRYVEVEAWFAGETFEIESSSTYPPASYPLLWLAIGWMSLGTARWAWTASCIILLAWLSTVAIRESAATGWLEKFFLAAFFFTSYGPLVTIGNGQLTIHVIAALLMTVQLWQYASGWLATAGAAVMMLAALVKPNIAAPFFWMSVFVAPSRITAGLVLAAYGVLTWFAGTFQPMGLVELFERWVATSNTKMLKDSYSDMPTWLHAIGLDGWTMHVSLAALALFGLWVWRHRRADPWLLLGVTAIVSRAWTKHLLYDDMLIFIPMIVLWKIAKQSEQSPSTAILAVGLFAGNWVAQLAPASLATMPAPASTIFAVGQPSLWLATLLFLSSRALANKERSSNLEQRPA